MISIVPPAHYTKMLGRLREKFGGTYRPATAEWWPHLIVPSATGGEVLLLATGRDLYVTLAYVIHEEYEECEEREFTAEQEAEAYLYANALLESIK